MKTVSEFVRKYGPWALVTGASSGIGAEFVRQLAAEGLSVVLAARRKALLDDLGAEISGRFGVQTRSVVVDLSEEDSVDRLGAAVADLDIGLIVSNAGTGNPGSYLDNDHREQLRLFRLNALAHLNIAHLFGRRLAERGGGGLLLGGAMGAAIGIPFSANEAGAKALVQSLGESLHVELRRKRIQVMTLVVPPTHTAIIEKFGLDPKTMPMKPMSTTQCVSEALKAFRKGRSLCLPGAANRIMSTIIPTSVMRVMMGKMLEQTLARRDGRGPQVRSA
ncbi:SDR family NAD(P)-dependent oxidoreductase [Luteimonas salinilitoris]|uniref:SDR family NAD(P)-dependent oxidoreductase n=1 Tax=Luteimonas salinilitoris TaxID=3237697 RepID=A0ABV4HVP2_9GAMM